MPDYTEIETRICKAEALGSFEKIIDQVIIIKSQIPKRMTLDECEKFHERQALMINKALRESLPQDTYDRLGIMFMMHKVSLYQGRTEIAL
ncbi:hypothetical protein KA005_19230 [bacterium]|nr:hypothetical protein [bacterium]